MDSSGAKRQTKARRAAGPSEQRAAKQPDPSEASGQPQKISHLTLKNNHLCINIGFPCLFWPF